MKNKIVQLCVVFGACVICVFTFVKVSQSQFVQFLTSAKSSPQPVSRQVEIKWDKMKRMPLQEEAMKGGEFHQPLKSFAQIPGVEMPHLFSLEESYLADSTPVIGVECEGDAIAIVEEEMTAPKTKVINLNFNRKKAVSISYCQVSDLVRVFSANSADPIGLGVGGFDLDDQLVLLLDGQRYAQQTEDVPLAEYPFQRTSLGQWRGVFPQTKICFPSLSVLKRRG